MEPRWYFNPDKAFQIARERNLPVMLDLYDSQSRFGMWVDAFIYRDSRIVDAFTRVVPLRMAAHGDGKALAKKYRFQPAPFVLFFHPDGTAYWRVSGRISPEGFLEQIRHAVRRMPEVPRIKGVASARKGSQAELAEAAVLASINGESARSTELIRMAEQSRLPCRELYEAYTCVGETCRLAGDYARSVFWYEKASTAKDRAVAARAMFGMANAHWRNQKPELAAQALRKIRGMDARAGTYRLFAERMMMRVSPVSMPSPPKAP